MTEAQNRLNLDEFVCCVMDGNIFFWFTKWLYKEITGINKTRKIDSICKCIERLGGDMSVTVAPYGSSLVLQRYKDIQKLGSGHIRWSLQTGNLMNLFQFQARFTLLLSHRSIQASACLPGCLHGYSCLTFQPNLPILHFNHTYIQLHCTFSIVIEVLTNTLHQHNR